MSVSARQSGFTLIEILIAIVIFSIGLLGIASLQIAGMRYTHGSQLRSVAVMQAESMSDLMRANSFGVESGFYNVANLAGGEMPTSYAQDCAVEECTAEERATYDLVLWNQHVDDVPIESNADVLPQGTGVVCRDSTPNDGTSADWECDDSGTVYAIKLEWQERTAGLDDDADDVDGDGVDLRVEHFVMVVLPAIEDDDP
jgi:type IV pilus assembly protein PilV